ncbi:MAG: tryptophan-rich sensory protein [Idiomarina sp.]|nr:tryptophan-rich sensory protein [Idiomarina sp.]
MQQTKLKSQVIGAVILLGLTFIAAAIGGIGSASAGSFYQQITQPDFAPPAWVFGPVWSVLYLMMGVAAFLVWRSAPLEKTRPVLTLYVIHLGVNALWSWLFFAWRSGLWASVGVVVLLALIIWVTLRFRHFSNVAALMMLPYLAWVSFATLLTITIWQMNPGYL